LTNSPDARDRKRTLRAELIQVRAKLSKEERELRSRAIADRAAALVELMRARTVALYSPLNTEVDPSEIARRLVAAGARIGWPRVQQSGRVLTFAACEPQALVRGPLGALEPPASARPIDLSAIEAVVMPGVAFSIDGLRLGRGGGYYDATLKLIPSSALKVGLGFDVQIVPTLPREPHDVPLDAVVTEARTLRFAR
jgi:5-formyltetrahydrofolate cyclo-ligase